MSNCDYIKERQDTTKSPDKFSDSNAISIPSEGCSHANKDGNLVKLTTSGGVEKQSVTNDISNCSQKIEKTNPKSLFNCIQLSPPTTPSPPPSTSATNAVNSLILLHPTSPRPVSDKITTSSTYPQSKNDDGISSSQSIKIDAQNKLEDSLHNLYFDKKSDPSVNADEIYLDCTSNKVVTSSGICSKSVPLNGLLLKKCDSFHKGNDQINKTNGSRTRFSPRKHKSSEPHCNSYSNRSSIECRCIKCNEYRYDQVKKMKYHERKEQYAQPLKDSSPPSPDVICLENDNNSQPQISSTPVKSKRHNNYSKMVDSIMSKEEAKKQEIIRSANGSTSVNIDNADKTTEFKKRHASSNGYNAGIAKKRYISDNFEDRENRGTDHKQYEEKRKYPIRSRKQGQLTSNEKRMVSEEILSSCFSYLSSKGRLKNHAASKPPSDRLKTPDNEARISKDSEEENQQQEITKDNQDLISDGTGLAKIHVKSPKISINEVSPVTGTPPTTIPMLQPLEISQESTTNPHENEEPSEPSSPTLSQKDRAMDICKAEELSTTELITQELKIHELSSQDPKSDTCSTDIPASYDLDPSAVAGESTEKNVSKKKILSLQPIIPDRLPILTAGSGIFGPLRESEVTLNPTENGITATSTPKESKNKGVQEQPRLVLKVKKSQIGNHWLKTEISEKSHKCQRSNNFKKRSKQTKMKMRFLRNSLNISCKENNGHLNTKNGTKLFVGNTLFQDLFSEMTMDTKCLLESLTMETTPSSIQDKFDPCFSHVMFKTWTVTHISLEAALRLCSLFSVHGWSQDETQKDVAASSIPTFILKTLNQIQRKPKIHVTRLQERKIIKECNKIVSSEHIIDRNEDVVQLKSVSTLKQAPNSDNGLDGGPQNGKMDTSNVASKPTSLKSKRIKHPTAKLMDSNLSFGMNSCLLASFSSEEDSFNSSGGSNGATLSCTGNTPQRLIEEEMPGQKQLSDADPSTEKTKNIVQIRKSPSVFNQSLPLPKSTLSELATQLEETNKAFALDILLANEDRKIGEKTKEFILENGWRFHGKLKPLYRHFMRHDSSQAYKMFTNSPCTTFKKRLHLNTNGQQNTSRMLRSSKFGTDGHSSDFGVHSKDCHAVKSKDVESKDLVPRKSCENIPLSSPEFTPYHSTDVPSRHTMHGGNRFLAEKRSPPKQLEKNIRLTLISSPSKSPFKVPQAINTKLKRRRLQDISSLEESSMSDHCEHENRNNGDLLESKFIDPRLLRKPYEPRTKKVVLARASVPRIPKPDSHQISEMNIRSRQSYNRREVAFSPAKRSIKAIRKFASNTKNCENSFGAVSRQKKNDNAILSDEAQKDMLNDDTNTATNMNNTATVNGEKAVKKVVKTIDMPTFTLAGIVENKPRELEGWFTNKIFQLKRLSSEPTSNSNSSSSFPISSTSSSMYSQSNPYANTSANGYNLTLNKLCQKNRDKAIDANKANVKVKYSEGAYQIMDFEEYKTSLVEKKRDMEDQKNEPSASDKCKGDDAVAAIEKLKNMRNNIVSLPLPTTARRNLFTNNLLNDIRELKHSRPYVNMNGVAAASTSPSNGCNGINNVSELLRVARRIEKISNQGIGRSKVHMRDVPFLPKGWMKVAKRQSFKNNQSPKIVIRQCVEYINEKGKTFDSLTSAIRFIAREQQILKRQRNKSY